LKRSNFLQKYLPKVVGIGLDFIFLIHKKFAAALAVRIFCTPRGGQLKPFHKKFLETTTPKKLILGEETIQTYYIDNESDKTVLLAHGWESNAGRWKKLVRYLSDMRINIVMLDGPAHGDSGFDRFTAVSYAEMINEVVKAYHVDLLIGHSIGAFSCGLYTKLFPDTDIKHFIILASPDTMTSILEVYQRILGFSDRLLLQIYTHFEVHFPHDLYFYEMSNFMKDSDINGLIMHDPMDMINTFNGAESIKQSWGTQCHLIPMNGLGHGLQDEAVYSNVKSYLEKAILLEAKN
jgi:hypothetical protein